MPLSCGDQWLAKSEPTGQGNSFVGLRTTKKGKQMSSFLAYVMRVDMILIFPWISHYLCDTAIKTCILFFLSISYSFMFSWRLGLSKDFCLFQTLYLSKAGPASKVIHRLFCSFLNTLHAKTFIMNWLSCLTSVCSYHLLFFTYLH